ncbi:NAD(P)/FAD-dependent oxidoreductase [Fulvivirga sediminis]|uniref:Geranylgeranyl reductase family protein n=1 Tax=Fulvivirga sediminis TaxID=2803949 RepID=A0A937F6P7_9BACT|nr:geranylgeranyl reductase family protein [Fulvivirga sediminis]MBL3655264.1 geranylgeranyl reductase family protein [Fulvivirga sediminis]
MEETNVTSYEVVIIGAGPAGCAAAIELGKAGKKTALIDKSHFPRDKTCGDALSVDVVNQLKKLSPELASNFKKHKEKIASYGVKIFAPNLQSTEIPFINEGKPKCGYICTRYEFDNLLFQHTCKYSSVSVFQNEKVNSFELQNGYYEIHTSSGILKAPLIIGADGAQSVVARKIALQQPDKKHHSGGLRVYYENVQGFTQDNKIELHFFKEILPGYLWIFPLPDGKANVGIGMLSSAIAAKKVNLKQVLEKLIKQHPSLKHRFENARPLETVKGFGLPLGSKKRRVSGNHYLLTGDAAGLIDPFSGEGIANAIRSGRIAAEHSLKCIEKADYSAAFNKAYDQYLYSKIWNELRISHALQRLCAYPWLFNLVINKANRNKHVHQFLVESLANVSVKKHLLNPTFYLKLLLS